MKFKTKLKYQISRLALQAVRKSSLNTSALVMGPLLILAGCGGGGGGGTPTGPTGISFSGNVVKGPLQNALVFIDYNGDGALSAGEPSTRTFADGSFNLNSTSSTADIISISDSQTVDSFTGKSVSGVTLRAPAGSTVVTPATTLLSELRDDSPGASETELAAALGLAGVDLTTFNPFEAGVDANLALAAEKVASQIIATVSSIAAAAEGTGAGKDIAFQKALDSVVSVVLAEMNDGNSSDSLSLSDSSVLEQVKDVAKTKLSSEVSSTAAFNKVLDQSIVAAENINTKVDSAQNLSDNTSVAIFSLNNELASQVLSSAQNETNTPGSGSVAFTDSSYRNCLRRRRRWRWRRRWRRWWRRRRFYSCT